MLVKCIITISRLWLRKCLRLPDITMRQLSLPERTWLSEPSLPGRSAFRETWTTVFCVYFVDQLDATGAGRPGLGISRNDCSWPADTRLWQRDSNLHCWSRPRHPPLGPHRVAWTKFCSLPACHFSLTKVSCVWSLWTCYGTCYGTKASWHCTVVKQQCDKDTDHNASFVAPAAISGKCPPCLHQTVFARMFSSFCSR